jgi:hypothetical protein
MTQATRHTPLNPQDLLPPGEEMAPEAPSDALGRYLALLMRWDVLSRQQQAYAQERARLEHVGAALATEWAEVEAEHTACLAQLAQAPLTLEGALREAWMLTKAHWSLVVEPNPASRGLMPEPLRVFLANRTFHPLGAKD